MSIDHLPQADEKLWVEPVGDFSGGMMGNAAVTVASLGISAGVVALIGNDARGEIVLDGVRLGVSPLSIRLPTRQSPVWLKVRKRGHAAVKTRVSLERDVRWDVELRTLAR